MRRDRVARLVESRRFSTAILLVILANAVILGWATYGGSALPYLLAVEHVLVVFFVVEMALKIYAWRRGFFRDPWNWFDFAVVLVSVIPVAGPFSVFRVLRVLRILRIITAVPEMRMIVSALFRSFPGMGTVIALLLVIVYTAAILGQLLFGASVPQYFGDLGTSLYTLFQVMTTENWPDVADAVTAHHSGGWIFFVLYIVVTAFIVLNLVIGVIVASMKEEVDRNRWDEDQRLEEVQHREVMERMAELGRQVERLEHLLREREGDRPPTVGPVVSEGAAEPGR
ncbi:ion transporter [Nocardiopsis sp. CNT312]|uniref:ion transporter n=1 Tax=Nocardiopsis sp. CNT312 TaxID=1137268 RepID=UPI001E32A428|nr:ion transporter [Nocardiopsis sp. CNT312]